MASKYFFQLDEIMPVFMPNSKQLLIKESASVDSYNVNKELYRIPDWVLKNTHLGNLGEYIVYRFLRQSKFSRYRCIKWVSRENDHSGYDISAQRFSEIYLFEVKTSQKVSDEISFYLTMNELQTALQHPRNYFVFYVEIEKERAYGTIIENIALKTSSLIKDGIILKDDDLQISCEQFKITLPKSKTFFQIDLSREFRDILKQKIKDATQT